MTRHTISKRLYPRRVLGVDLPRYQAPGSVPDRPDPAEPRVTASTRVTVAPAFIDRRFAADPEHVGEFSAEWDRLRGVKK